MSLGNIVELTMGWAIQQVLDNPDTPEKIKNTEVCIGLHAGLNEIVYLDIQLGTTTVHSYKQLRWWNSMKRISDASIETDWDTFYALGLNRISPLKFMWLVLKRKIKITGLFTLLKFKKLLKLVNGG